MCMQPQAIIVAFHSHAADGTLNEVTLWLMVIACMEFLLMGTLTLCTQTNSALTTTVVGVLKGTLAVALGFVLLGGVGPTTTTNIMGITFNCLGGVWYAFAKYREGKSNSGKGFNSA
ncbi:hypothetical protein DUNSADRAFT_3066 [Dunaliella salina]|uniref:Sugar phosphate transporter domain-containing protein n=1 Tax=Dunaliella salina TaxID=3046 RepID=A0ABQ7FVN4_DUNSA|nr:hypothetical protein DUNSADRAFT_3066 [Dunaliella salina]|eukprot:KAF5826445.1 hypothetical protein DUNSADRAFT_3066 [Dunaliella salina]